MNTEQGQNCPTCQKHGRDDDYFIAEYSHFKVFHYPSEKGLDPIKSYLLVESKRHVESFRELENEESQELGSLIVDLSAVAENIFSAEQVYVFRIGDMVKHLHFHLVPRYKNTPNEFWGDKIRSYTGGPRATKKILSETIAEFRKRV